MKMNNSNSRNRRMSKLVIGPLSRKSSLAKAVFSSQVNRINLFFIILSLLRLCNKIYLICLFDEPLIKSIVDI